jgi:hypothetical protein
VALLVSLPALAGAADLAGVKLEPRARVGDKDLVLNGVGLRKRAFFKVYVAGLYLTEKRKSPAEILALPGPKRVSVTLLRSIPARRLVDGLTDDIRENSSPEEQRAIRLRLAELATYLLAREHGKHGDVITFDWLPETGTRVALNGQVEGRDIPGDDLYRAVLRVWLGERPSSAALKKALLGT